MSAPLHNEMAEALAQLREQQSLITDAVGKLSSTSATATSDDHMIEATVDAQGKLTGLKLTGRRWRDLAPKELAAKLVDVVNRAQDEAGRKSSELVSAFLPQGMDFDKLRTAGPDIDAMFSAALESLDGKAGR
ncbi:hypothetical protein GCM10022267_75700 [Lentzea roselyniae]|uniref:YbaB/EbfC DNA-binding family protein n=1 Tax=Lentzea roselyniae TaxID=531940 RepID=A0ABP7C482_9PSEU